MKSVVKKILALVVMTEMTTEAAAIHRLKQEMLRRIILFYSYIRYNSVKICRGKDILKLALTDYIQVLPRIKLFVIKLSFKEKQL